VRFSGRDTLIGETSAERALGRELRSYRRRAARLLLAGFVLLGFGIVLAFFFTPSDTAPRNDLWLYRTYGESGLVWASAAVRTSSCSRRRAR
jgi:hypothetical protein